MLIQCYPGIQLWQSDWYVADIYISCASVENNIVCSTRNQTRGLNQLKVWFIFYAFGNPSLFFSLSLLLFILCFVYLLRQNLTMYLNLALNSVYSPSYSQTYCQSSFLGLLRVISMYHHTRHFSQWMRLHLLTYPLALHEQFCLWSEEKECCVRFLWNRPWFSFKCHTKLTFQEPTTETRGQAGLGQKEPSLKSNMKQGLLGLFRHGGVQRRELSDVEMTE